MHGDNDQASDETESYGMGRLELHADEVDQAIELEAVRVLEEEIEREKLELPCSILHLDSDGLEKHKFFSALPKELSALSQQGFSFALATRPFALMSLRWRGITVMLVLPKRLPAPAACRVAELLFNTGEVLSFGSVETGVAVYVLTDTTAIVIVDVDPGILTLSDFKSGTKERSTISLETLGSYRTIGLLRRLLKSFGRKIVINMEPEAGAKESQSALLEETGGDVDSLVAAICLGKTTEAAGTTRKRRGGKKKQRANGAARASMHSTGDSDAGGLASTGGLANLQEREAGACGASSERRKDRTEITAAIKPGALATAAAPEEDPLACSSSSAGSSSSIAGAPDSSAPVQDIKLKALAGSSPSIAGAPDSSAPVQDIEDCYINPIQLQRGLMSCVDCHIESPNTCNRRSAVVRALKVHLKADVSCSFTFASAKAMRHGPSEVVLRNAQKLKETVEKDGCGATDAVSLVEKAELAVAMQDSTDADGGTGRHREVHLALLRAKLAEHRANMIETKLLEPKALGVGPAKDDAAAVLSKSPKLATTRHDYEECLACSDCKLMATCELRKQIEELLQAHPVPDAVCSFTVAAVDSIADGLDALVERSLSALVAHQRLLLAQNEEEALARVASLEAQPSTMVLGEKTSTKVLGEKTSLPVGPLIPNELACQLAARHMALEERLTRQEAELAHVTWERNAAQARLEHQQAELLAQHVRVTAAEAQMQAMHRAYCMERWHLQQKQQHGIAGDWARGAALLTQINFYFSPSNLQEDDFLRRHMQHNTGFVPLQVILAFPRIVRLQATMSELVALLSYSPTLELSPQRDSVRLRLGWEQYLSK